MELRKRYSAVYDAMEWASTFLLLFLFFFSLLFTFLFRWVAGLGANGIGAEKGSRVEIRWRLKV